jgi:hypothetical protein
MLPGFWNAQSPPGADFTHMRAVAEHMVGVAGAVSLVEPPEGVPAGWDAADTVADGRDLGALLADLELPRRRLAAIASAVADLAA